MPNLNAALLCAQLEQLDLFLKNKKRLAETYKTFFENSSYTMRWEAKNTTANFWLICLELENKESRDLFLKETNENNVMTRPIWKLMFKLPMYEACFRDAQKNAAYLEERIVNIPSSYRKNG